MLGKKYPHILADRGVAKLPERHPKHDGSLARVAVRREEAQIPLKIALDPALLMADATLS